MARRIAATQHGLITRDDARRCELSDRQIRARVADRRWVRESLNVFSLGGLPSSRRRQLLLATLRTGAAASHWSAAWLHQLEVEPPERAHVIRRSGGGHHHSDLVLHRSERLLPRDLTTVDSIPVTNAIRTILDLAAVYDEAQLRGAIDVARRRRLIHPGPLIARHLEIARPGRPGTSLARRVLEQLDADLALTESDLETRLLMVIARAGLPAPVRQHSVEISGSTYRIDMAYPERLLAIEGDGFEFHSGRDIFERDRVRQNDLVLAGWRVLRFTWRQICREPEWVAEQIRRALA